MRSERFKVVSIIDEAIDVESMTVAQVNEYIEKRDINMISRFYRTGMQPAVFHVRAVHHSMWESFVKAGGDHDDVMFRRAFMCGVERVDNLPSKDGTLITFEPTSSLNGIKVMSNDECNDRFAPSEVLEIGSVIFRHSFLPLRNRLTWLLPSLCAGPLGHRLSQSVAVNQSTAKTTTSEQPSATTEATQETASA